MFVMYVVSLPMYVKLAHFWVVWVVVGLLGLGVGGLCGFIGKEPTQIKDKATHINGKLPQTYYIDRRG